MFSFLTTGFSSLAGLFFPERCAVCGQTLQRQEEVLCTACYYKLPVTGFHQMAENPVSDIFQGRLPVVSATSFLFFSKGGATQQLVHQLKYKGKKAVGLYLGRLLGNQLNETPFFREADFIVPVPLHPKKEHVRGYNQSLLIAEGMAMRLPARVIKDVLFRKVHSATQTKKSRYERWENVKDIFEVRKGGRLKGKRIILVDDVITTGATLEACGKTLLQIPGVSLCIASLAYAQG